MVSEQPLEFHPEALDELERAKAWYSAQRHGLGESFFLEITMLSLEFWKLPTLGRNISEERDASSCIGFRLQSSMVNAQPACSS